MCNSPCNENSFWTWLKRIVLIAIIVKIGLSLKDHVESIKKNLESPPIKIGWINLTDEITSASSIINECFYFSEREDIPAVILHIDSPGGYCGSSELIYKEIKRLNKKKPVFGFIENNCLSGAYLILQGCSKSVAQTMSTIGGIGVTSDFFSFKKCLDNYNIEYENLSKGEFKSVGNKFAEKMSEKQKKYVLGLQENCYEAFLDIVSENRGLKKANFKTWADGKVFTGASALKENLIDEIGDLSSVLSEIKSFTQVDKDQRVLFIKYPRKEGLNRFFSQDQESIPENTKKTFSITDLWSSIKSYLKILS